jgi:hypothetical protein
MNIFKEVMAELISMFVADVRLTLAILGVVALAAGLIKTVNVAPLIGGAFLLAGCLGVTVAAVVWSAREVKTRND